MAQPTTRRDRWLALALLIAVIGVAYLLLVHPWFTQPLRAIDADIAGLQERQQRVQAQLQQIQANLRTTEQPALQETLAALATAAKVRVVRISGGMPEIISGAFPSISSMAGAFSFPAFSGESWAAWSCRAATCSCWAFRASNRPGWCRTSAAATPRYPGTSTPST